jgi:hypothetical protein
MPDCKLIEGCVFFNDKMQNKPVSAEMLKKNFCKGKNTHCARYIVFEALGKENVPADLFPNDIERGLKLASQRQR